MIRASKDSYLSRPFVLTPEDLVKLESAIKGFGGITTIKIGCADKLDRQFSSIADLLKFENPVNKGIKSVRIFGEMTSHTSLLLRLDNNSVWNIYYSIQGSEQSVLEFVDAIEERASAMKPWYSPYKGSRIVSSIFELITILFLSYLLVGLLIKVLDLLNVPVPQSSIYQAIIVSLMYLIAGGLSMFSVIRISNRVFPMGAFAIGQGAKRHNNQEIVRIVVIAGFVINVIAGLVVWFISSTWR